MRAPNAAAILSNSGRNLRASVTGIASSTTPDSRHPRADQQRDG
jgi:hypothetical protein